MILCHAVMVPGWSTKETSNEVAELRPTNVILSRLRILRGESRPPLNVTCTFIDEHKDGRGQAALPDPARVAGVQIVPGLALRKVADGR